MDEDENDLRKMGVRDWGKWVLEWGKWVLETGKNGC
jgi:hypothetical protein